MVSGNAMIIHLIFGLTKKMLYKMSYFPGPYTHSKPKWMKVELDLANYCTTKSKLKIATKFGYIKIWLKGWLR